MIEVICDAPAFTVVCDQTGDTADADDEVTALVIARTLLADARAAYSWQGFKPTASFYGPDGEPIVGLNHVGQPAIWHALRIDR